MARAIAMDRTLAPYHSCNNHIARGRWSVLQIMQHYRAQIDAHDLKAIPVLGGRHQNAGRAKQHGNSDVGACAAQKTYFTVYTPS